MIFILFPNLKKLHPNQAKYLQEVHWRKNCKGIQYYFVCYQFPQFIMKSEPSYHCSLWFLYTLICVLTYSWAYLLGLDVYTWFPESCPFLLLNMWLVTLWLIRARTWRIWVARCAKSVVIMLAKMQMMIHSLLVMYVHFLSVGLAMNMKGRMGISHVLNAKPDTRGIKVLWTLMSH